ncbi:hypothetical protein RND81_04G056000 [Saponaria officinalis]|uniref:Uncharacterized protein n=1 Tax=Saponaria officinalis TaxID=3572 RepID=A0AAW1LF44_SAPOF
MSVCCGFGCVAAIGFTRWFFQRCTYMGSHDSATWPAATLDEFSPIPRLCRLILAVYEPDIHHPINGPPGGYDLNTDHIIKHVTYEHTVGHEPPYLIYVDHPHREIILAIRGLNLMKESDYKLLIDNHLGRQMFDGGYVHHGLLKSATWLLNKECDTLKSLWLSTGKSYKMIFAGHSLGSGVAALLAIIAVNHRDKLGGIPRNLVSCYAIAPARCMSLNLAVKYADVIHSVILQDDFLPRMTTPLEDIFKSIFCLPCLMFVFCLRDTFIPEQKKLRDPRRLYAPGRMYHIVNRKFCRCGRFPPEVRTAIPVEKRFEHVVLSCHATSDHAIVWIEREAEKAFQKMEECSGVAITSAPRVQRIERLQTIEKEHKDALERAVSLNMPYAVSAEMVAVEEELSEAVGVESGSDSSSMSQLELSNGSTNWNQMVAKLCKMSENGDSLLNDKK